MSSAINEEAIRFNRQQPPSQTQVTQSNPPKPAPKGYKTGYEAYKNPGYIPDLQVDASLWGTGPSRTGNLGAKQAQLNGLAERKEQDSTGGAPAKKMMSLEEVEAAMRSQPKKPTLASQQPAHASSPANPPLQLDVLPSTGQKPQQVQGYGVQATYPQQYRSGQRPPFQDAGPSLMAQQRPFQQPGHHASKSSQSMAANLPIRSSPASQAPQAAASPHLPQRGQNMSYQTSDTNALNQPRQILQNPNRHSGQFTMAQPEPPTQVYMQAGVPPSIPHDAPVPLPVIYHPSQIINLTEEERYAYLVEEAKRAKRNHKIFLLSKGNGLMTPQDKNFITRIQLQQLMTATGSVNDQDPDASLSEDFYYQVYNQIENRPRQNPLQPLSNFAQTYLFQTGGRQGGMGRRQRGGDSHMQRMEQQVQRAVEAAKVKPKNKQLVIEGSLGKISFSNAKTPKPLLSIKRHDSSDVTNRAASTKAHAALSTTDRKAVLKNIEAVYSTLMKMEDHDRHLPQRPNQESNAPDTKAIKDWQQDFQDLNQQLWMDLKVTEPIMPDSAILHPFIAFLSYPKGKKAIPRIFNHIDQNQRLTILTMITIHLDILDVIRLVQPQLRVAQPSSIAREQVDLFLQAVMPSLLSYITDAQLMIIIGLLGLVVDRINLSAVAPTRVGLQVLTMFLSRAAIVKALETPNDQTWEQWLNVYNHFFDLIEPLLGEIFPTSVNAGQDQYVWQFLAATGSGANPEQQQRLVLAVK